MKDFLGYHSEWNLGSPGGWDYQRISQIIGKAVWKKLNGIKPMGVDLDFDHPLLYPVRGFVDMLATEHFRREGKNPGLIAIVAEEETLADVTENRNLSEHLSRVDGLTGALMAPHELETRGGRVCYRGTLVSLIFMDFNTDVLLSLHRKQGLEPALQAVREGRVINPRGTEPINVKSMFEVITGEHRDRFHKETVVRTPWTRRFYPRKTDGPKGEIIDDIEKWARENWKNLVLKPERGYSGKGVRVGGVNNDVDEAIQLAVREGEYILQEKIPLGLWAEEIPELVDGEIRINPVQTDFRCLIGPDTMFGFLVRYGGVPTNVGSGGGFQPLGVLQSDMSVREAVDRMNHGISSIHIDDILEVIRMQDEMSIAHAFTYLLGPIKMALRPRVVTLSQLDALKRYCMKMWDDCLLLEKMYKAGALDSYITIEDEELEISESQPWEGSPAIIASDGLFSFGSHLESKS